MKKVSFGGIFVEGYEVIRFLYRRHDSIVVYAIKNGNQYLLKFDKSYSELYYVESFECATVARPIETFKYRDTLGQLFKPHLIEYYVSVYTCFTCDLSHMLKVMDKIPMQMSLRIIEDCLSAIYYLKSVQVLHNNINPSNVLIYIYNDGSVGAKLRDFQGAAVIEENELCYSFVRDIKFFAPEFATGHSFPADVFALGATLKLLWDKTVKTGNQQVASIISSLLDKMVQKDPKERPSAEYLYGIMYYVIMKRPIPNTKIVQEKKINENDEVLKSSTPISFEMKVSNSCESF